MLKRAALLLALIPAAAQAAQPGVQPSAPDKIVAATMDCWAAVGQDKVDRALLQSRGWKAGEMKSPKGQAIKSELAFYGRADSPVMILLADTDKAKGACTVVSRVATPADIGKTATLLNQTIKAVAPDAKAVRSKLSIAFFGGSRMAMLEPTGTKEKPATRIGVIFAASEKK